MRSGFIHPRLGCSRGCLQRSFSHVPISLLGCRGRLLQRLNHQLLLVDGEMQQFQRGAAEAMIRMQASVNRTLVLSWSTG